MELLTGRMIYGSRLTPGITRLCSPLVGWRESEKRAGKILPEGRGVNGERGVGCVPLLGDGVT